MGGAKAKTQLAIFFSLAILLIAVAFVVYSLTRSGSSSQGHSDSVSAATQSPETTPRLQPTLTPRKHPTTAPATQSSSNSDRKSGRPDYTDKIQRIGVILQSNDPASADQAIAYLKKLSVQEPDSFTEVFPRIIDPLLGTKHYQAIEVLAFKAITLRPQTPTLVSEAQRAIVESLMAEHRYDDAVSAAKGYYNVVTLKDTSSAVELLATALEKRSGPDAARHFRDEQRNASVLSGGNSGSNKSTLQTITIDDKPYDPVIEKTRAKSDSYGTLMSRGNLLLLADHPTEARQCFTAAGEFVTTASDPSKLRNILEGIARAIRAQTGSAGNANGFILAIQRSDTNSLPPEFSALDSDMTKTAARNVNLANLSAVVDLPLQ